MTQLFFQRFSQTIGRFVVRLNRSVSYCRGAHWLSYFFLKFPGPHISEKLEIFVSFYRQGAWRLLFSGERTRTRVLSLAACRRLFFAQQNFLPGPDSDTPGRLN